MLNFFFKRKNTSALQQAAADIQAALESGDREALFKALAASQQALAN